MLDGVTECTVATSRAIGETADPMSTVEHREPKRRRYWNPRREFAWLMVPPAVFLAMFLLLPLMRVVIRSFAEPTLTMTNYARVFSDISYMRAFSYTLEVALSVTALCLLIGYPLAYAIARARGVAQKLISVLVLLPLWTSVVIRSYAWLILFQRRGALNGLLLSIGLVKEPIDILQTSFAVEIGMVHILLPVMVLPLVASMMAIDPTLLRAGRILGARPLRLFLRVYLRLTMPGISAGCVLVFISALGFFVTPSLLGGARNAMAAVVIEQAVSVFFDWPLASALSTVLLLITIGIYLAYARLTGGELQVALK
jgi:putative spermidine/putrescine transport system permease protein/mannopine transport system permease protein